MKTQRELLELAAKAAGIDGWWESAYLSFILRSGGPWRPLDDDGDALRLAVKLRIRLPWGANDGVVRVDFDRIDQWPTTPIYESVTDGDTCAATRLAITRAAAAIGEGMAQSAGSTELPEDNYYKSQAEAEEAGRAAAIGEVPA